MWLPVMPYHHFFFNLFTFINQTFIVFITSTTRTTYPLYVPNSVRCDDAIEFGLIGIIWAAPGKWLFNVFMLLVTH